MNLRYGAFIKTVSEEVLHYLGEVVINGTTNLVCCSIENFRMGGNLMTIFVPINKVEILDFVFPEED